jgi:hypothetical protein
MGPKKGADGKFAITFPMGDRKLPGMAAEDIGACAYGIFKNGRAYIGKTVGVAGGHLTGAQMAALPARSAGGRQRGPPTSTAVRFPGAEDLGNMFQFKHDFAAEFCAARDLPFSRSLHPGLQTFDTWLAASAKRIPVE